MPEILLDWYDRHHRELPWRVAPAALNDGARPDPYHVWLSEVMLQQTLVEAVKPYFVRFRQLWPDVDALAASNSDDVMKAWAGLGYYSRARNLKKCAKIVSGRYGGRFPETVSELKKLPGIGEYTASAIAAIAFGRPAPVVDGNVERVISRLAAIATPLPDAKREIRSYVEKHVPADRPGDFAQATMDLGATICTPKNPSCFLCPLQDCCTALQDGDPVRFPVKPPKKNKPLRRGAAYVAVRADGAVLLRKRPEKGLLGGMSEVATTDWTSRQDGETGVSAAPFPADWQKKGEIRHVFTHFELKLDIFLANGVSKTPIGEGWWSLPQDLPGEALPTVMKKAIEAVIPGATKTIAARRRTN